MHHKVAVLGRTRLRVITDAANWTKAALGSRTKRARNHESILFIDSAALDDGRTGRRYLNQWLRVLRKYAEQSVDQDGERTYADVAAELRGAADWPAQPVAFVAHETHTAWGERAGVSGNLPQLGDWGRQSPVLLQTDSDTYPTWWQASEVAQIPTGVRFKWKLVIADDHGNITRWESGQDRSHRAYPQALHPDAALTLQGTWR